MKIKSETKKKKEKKNKKKDECKPKINYRHSKHDVLFVDIEYMITIRTQSS